MAKSYKYEVYESEQDLETFLNDPLCAGMKPISIYRRTESPAVGQDSVIVWWEIEDSNEEG